MAKGCDGKYKQSKLIYRVRCMKVVDNAKVNQSDMLQFVQTRVLPRKCRDGKYRTHGGEM